MFIFVNKSLDMYEMPSETYNRLLHKNITKPYQKTDPNVKSRIDNEAKKLAKPLKLDGRMEGYTNRSAFITLRPQK